jgi:hypothetical protein
LNTRSLCGGYFVSLPAGRIGRLPKLPPQFGQTPPSFVSTQSRQNVHSKVQIIASVAAGGRSLSQHSQFGRKASMATLLMKPPVCGNRAARQ